MPLADETPTSPDSGRRLRLGDRSKSLLEALGRADPELEQMYLAALQVLGDEALADAIPLAAHALRELMEKMPKPFDVRTRDYDAKPDGAVRQVRDSWWQATATSACRSGADWSGEIDPPLQRLLTKVDALTAWCDQNWPSAADTASALVECLDGGIPTPPNSEDDRAAIFVQKRRFFIDCSHHRKPGISRDDFVKAVMGLEDFLYDLLIGEATSELAEILTLITAAENHD